MFYYYVIIIFFPKESQKIYILYIFRNKNVDFFAVVFIRQRFIVYHCKSYIRTWRVTENYVYTLNAQSL